MVKETNVVQTLVDVDSNLLKILTWAEHARIVELMKELQVTSNSVDLINALQDRSFYKMELAQIVRTIKELKGTEKFVVLIDAIPNKY